MPDNATPAQARRIDMPWIQCLQAHGYHTLYAKGGESFPGSNIPAATAAACRTLRPHPPWQEIPSANPHFNQDMAGWVNCMNAHGVPAKLVPGGFNFTGPRPLPPDAMHVQTLCEMKAFGEH